MDRLVLDCIANDLIEENQAEMDIVYSVVRAAAIYEIILADVD